MTTRTARALIALVAGFSLVAAACGSDDATTTTETSASTDAATATDPPATDPPAESEAPAADTPQRIVSLSPTHTETLFAIGADDQLVAIDDQSNHPPEAQELPNELSSFEPNIEAIAAYEPDLVVLSDGGFSGVIEQLDAIDIAWWDGPPAASIDEAFTQIEELGAVTGNAAEADALLARMRADIDRIVADTEVPDPAPSFYHEISPDYYSATTDTFVGEVYALLGLENVADPAGEDGITFPQLNAEFLVEADPDLIFLADTKCCGETAETVAARDGWAEMTAVVDGNVIELDDDIASRWGVRMVDLLQEVSDAVEQALAAA